jgi:hypothetical protein
MPQKDGGFRSVIVHRYMVTGKRMPGSVLAIVDTRFCT